MYDLATINAEQLVTRTDRVLFGNLRKHELARGTANLTIAARLAVARSDERTVYVREARRSSSYAVAIGTAAAIVWLAVGLVCLLA